MSEIIVNAINEKSKHLQAVVQLGTENSSTLGFLPEQAFVDSARDNHILVATDRKGVFLGYLLYAVNKRQILVYITHLCVKPDLRRAGVAKALFKQLCAITADSFRGIRVHCRRDYKIANKVWPKLGFTPRSEKDGRSKHGSILTQWWLDHHHQNLLTFLDQQRTCNKIRVVIDANIFYDLQTPPTPINKQSHFLLSGWLQEEVALCITNEIFLEIHRQDDPQQRRKSQQFAQQFVTLQTSLDSVEQHKATLRPFFPRQLSVSDESDLNQVAHAVSAGVSFFVTRDKQLRKRVGKRTFELFGMHIIRPIDLIINRDVLLREAEYSPAKLAGSRIRNTRILPDQIELVEDTFYAHPQETKHEFREKLLPCLADPHAYHTSIMQDAQNPLALLVHDRQNEQEITIPLLRVAKSPLSATLARYLVFHTVVNASKEHRYITRITDTQVSDEIVDALQENGFLAHNGEWVKINLPIVTTSEGLVAELVRLGQAFPSTEQLFARLTDVLKSAAQQQNNQTLLRIERALWPAKILDLALPAFVVSIQAPWAMQLFDQGISEQDLFGANPNLILQLENVYYRSSRTKNLNAPARVLWYVSKGESHYQGIKSLRACSYLDEVVIDKPKVLFSRFKRLGVYQWKDVYKLANNDIAKDIMAFRFSNTETFESSIELETLHNIWREERGTQFQALTPVSITNELFVRLYTMGFPTVKIER